MSQFGTLKTTPEFARQLKDVVKAVTNARGGIVYKPGYGLTLNFVPGGARRATDGGTEAVGQYIGMAHLVVAQNVGGWDFIRYTAPLT